MAYLIYGPVCNISLSKLRGRSTKRDFQQKKSLRVFALLLQMAEFTRAVEIY